MKRPIWLGVAVLLLVVSAAAIAVMSPGSTDSTVAAKASDISSPAAAGLRVFLDPETGETLTEPVPNAVIELDEELQNAMRHDDAGLITVRHADGSESLNLEGRYAEASFVRIDENGKHIICSANATDVEKALEAEASNAPEVK